METLDEIDDWFEDAYEDLEVQLMQKIKNAKKWHAKQLRELEEQWTSKRRKALSKKYSNLKLKQ